MYSNIHGVVDIMHCCELWCTANTKTLIHLVTCELIGQHGAQNGTVFLHKTCLQRENYTEIKFLDHRELERTKWRGTEETSVNADSFLTGHQLSLLQTDRHKHTSKNTVTTVLHKTCDVLNNQQFPTVFSESMAGGSSYCNI